MAIAISNAGRPAPAPDDCDRAGADKTEMNVLIVSFWFPPSNVVGAIRVGKLARYLDRRGYGLRVLTTDIGEDRSLPLEIAREQVIYTEYRQPKDRLASIIRSFRGKGASRVIGGDLTGVTDRTPGQPSTFEPIKDNVRDIYAQEVYQDILQRQRKASKIEMLMQ